MPDVCVNATQLMSLRATKDQLGPFWSWSLYESLRFINVLAKCSLNISWLFRKLLRTTSSDPTTTECLMKASTWFWVIWVSPWCTLQIDGFLPKR